MKDTCVCSKSRLKFKIYVIINKYKKCNYVELCIFFTHFLQIPKNLSYICYICVKISSLLIIDRFFINIINIIPMCHIFIDSPSQNLANKTKTHFISQFKSLTFCKSIITSIFVQACSLFVSQSSRVHLRPLLGICKLLQSFPRNFSHTMESLSLKFTTFSNHYPRISRVIPHIFSISASQIRITI